MNERPPTPPGAHFAEKNARRNYIVFCGIGALFLFLAVLFGSLLVAA